MPLNTALLSPPAGAGIDPTFQETVSDYETSGVLPAAVTGTTATSTGTTAATSSPSTGILLLAGGALLLLTMAGNGK